jgi:hypothetical protein
VGSETASTAVGTALVDAVGDAVGEAAGEAVGAAALLDRVCEGAGRGERSSCDDVQAVVASRTAAVHHAAAGRAYREPRCTTSPILAGREDGCQCTYPGVCSDHGCYP